MVLSPWRVWSDINVPRTGDRPEFADTGSGSGSMCYTLQTRGQEEQGEEARDQNTDLFYHNGTDITHSKVRHDDSGPYSLGLRGCATVAAVCTNIGTGLTVRKLYNATD